jgi:hypothetical protein
MYATTGTKKPTTVPKPAAGDMRQKPSTANKGDDLDSNSVVLVAKVKNKGSANQKRPGDKHEPNW